MLLAHDIGTTGNKATLFDASGAVLGAAFAPYATRYPRPGWAEQDPEAWWRAVCLCTRQLRDQCPEAMERLEAVGFCGMMNGCLLVDARGVALRPCLIHADLRSQEQCERIARAIGAETAYQKTGNRIAPYFTLGKLAWLVEHEPDVVRQARWCLQAKDYIVGRMTGVWGVTDASDASLTGCFALEKGVWDADLVAAGGFSQELLPQVLPSAQVIGRVHADAATATGLRPGIPVVLGGGDGACATAGAGAVRPGDTYHYLGGTSWVAVVTDRYMPDPTGRVSVFCGLEPGQWVTYGTVQSAGSSVDWFQSAIGVGPDASTDAFAALEQIAASAAPGCDGLFFLPYLAGERSPIWDARARGVYFGLTTAHGRAELARAVLEGVAFALRSNLVALEDLGHMPESVRVLGGGMRSALWRQIFAGVYGRPLRPMIRLLEATSCGAAMAAAVAIGLFPDYTTAAACFAPEGEEEAPDPTLCAVYARAFAFFQTLYPALAARFAALSALMAGDAGYEEPHV
ncbi:MAG: xylulokinase [Chloroherpetonaceae bacterium]|nr:xylulokinase [Chthonomonadaceae bacterium]MDW8207187.1 xylulokinase [Chloroherpetonaceae bacterium]